MRKKLLIILVVFCLVVIFFRFNNKNEEIRVRIIPRDNSKEGIEEKNKVKKVVLFYLENIYCDDYSKMLKEINTSYIDLEEELKEYVPDINVSFSKHTLYNKTYNNSAVENEEFYTLYVVLGELLPEAFLMFKSKLPALFVLIGLLLGLLLVQI